MIEHDNNQILPLISMLISHPKMDNSWVNVLQDKLELQMNNNRNEPTTRHGTTIDAGFSRYLSNLHSKT